MKDLMGLSRKASDITKNTEAYRELFADLFLEEMKKMKGTDLAKYLSCELSYENGKAEEYKVILTLPVELFDEFYPFESNIKG